MSVNECGSLGSSSQPSSGVMTGCLMCVQVLPHEGAERTHLVLVTQEDLSILNPEATGQSPFGPN